MSEKYYMSSIQKRLYVVCSMKIDDVSYNTPKFLRLMEKLILVNCKELLKN